MDLLAQARKSLSKSIESLSAPSGQAHALDSIAASLLYMANNIETKPITDEHIELIARRLLDNTKTAQIKKTKRGK